MPDIQNHSNSRYFYDHKCLQNPFNHRHTFLLHSHNTYELLFFEGGDATYVIEDRKYRLKKNDLVFIRPRRYHYIDLQSNSEYLRIKIAFEADFVGKELLRSIPEDIEVINCPKKSIIVENLSRMDYYRDNLAEEDFESVLSSLLLQALEKRLSFFFAAL